MAFSQGSLVAWSDIVSLFSSLNTARQKFGYAAVTPANAGFAQGASTVPSQVSNLKTYIEQVSGHVLVGSTAVTGVTVPAVGSLLKFDIFNKFTTTISNISNTCLHFVDNSFDSSDNNFDSSDDSFDSGDNSFDRSDDSFDSSDDGDHSFNTGCFEFNSCDTYDFTNDNGESNSMAGCAFYSGDGYDFSNFNGTKFS